MSVGTSIGQIFLDLVINTGGIKKQLDGVTKSLGAVGKLATAAFSVKAITQFTKSCLQLGSDLAEVQNVVDVTFSTMSSSVNQWAKDAMTSFGLSEKVAKEYVGQLGAMSKAFGNTEGVAYDQATSLAGLVGDVASFYNLTTDEAFTKLKAVYTGETEALKSLGVVMTQAALDEYALAKGFGKTTNAMTEQEKVALRLSFVQDRLSDASGDFERTSGGWANQVRMLSLRFDALKASIGQGLINVLLPVVRLLNQIVARLQVAADAFRDFSNTLFGNSASTSAAAAMAGAGTTLADGLESGATSAASIKRSLAGFDKINVLGNSNKGSSSSMIHTGIAVDNIDASAAETDLNKFADVISNVLSPAAKTFYDTGIAPIINWLRGKLADAVNFAKKIFDDWAQWFIDNKEPINNFAALLGNVIASLWALIEPLADMAWETFKGVLKIISDLFQGFFQWILDNQETVTTALGGIIAALIAYKIVVGISDMIDKFRTAVNAATIAQKLMTAAQAALNAVMSINPIALLIAGIVALVAAFVILWNKSEAFRNFWIGIWDNIKSAFNKTVDWFKTACSRIGDFFKNLGTGIKGVFNDCLGGIEKFINSIIRGINTLIGGLNKVSVKIPDWVPGIGGNSFGVNIPTLSTVNLPRLASGGYVAANTPQLAIIGDNKREGEIVAPESKIADAVAAGFAKVLNKLPGNSTSKQPMYLTIKLGEDTFWEGYTDYHNDIVVRTGNSPLLV